MYDKFFKSLTVVSIILFGALGICFSARAQDLKVDSLKALLPTLERNQKFDVLYELFKWYFEKDNQSALAYAEEAHLVALGLGDSLMIVKSGRAKGYMQMKMGDLESALKNFIVALSIAKRNEFQDQVKFLLNNIASAYAYQANYDKALDYHFQSLVIREAEGDKSEMSVAYNNIGQVYYMLKDFDQALTYFNKSVDLSREIKDDRDLDKRLINVGLCYNSLGQHKKAIEVLTEALAICGNPCSEYVLTQGHFVLGNSYLELGKIEEAKDEYLTSYENAVKADSKRFQAESLLQLHRVSFQEENYQQALSYVKQVEEILREVGFNELKIEMYRAFAKLYSTISDYKSASIYQARYIQLKDSIYSDELIRNLARVQTDYEERENIATIAAKEEVIERQRKLNLAVVVIAVLSGLLVFVLFRSNQIKKKVNNALSEAKVTIENQNKQLTILNKSLEKMVDARTMELQVANEALKRVNDELDNFIYKTSHDIRGPLASLKGMCNVAIMDVKDELALSYFYKLDATAERLNTILTRLLIINQINNSSASLELIDFRSIIDDVVILERKKGLPPKLTIRKEIQPGIVFYSDKELIRIILENLIDNAIKFYNDSGRVDPFVDIKIGSDNGEVKIRVLDNGIGISQINPDKIFQMFSRASERSGTGGIGLYLTKTATEKLGGFIDLKTTPEGYTEFYVKFTLIPQLVNQEVTLPPLL